MIQKKRGTGPLSAPLASFDGICLPFGPPCAEAIELQLPAARHERRRRRDAVRADGQLRLRGVLEDGGRASPRDADQGAVVAAWEVSAPRTTTETRWWSTTSTPAAGCCRSSSRSLRRASRTGSASRCRRRVTRPVRTTSTSSTWARDTFLDYPHFGVWRDGYYMSANEFPTGQETSSGAAAIVYERDKMLVGQPARFVWFDEAAANPVGGQYIGQLPADADGSRLPPAGEPNVFAEVDDPASIPPQGTDTRLRPAAVELPRRLVEPAGLDVRERRAAELDAAGRAVRAAAVHLRLRRLRAPEGRAAGARRARRPAHVPARVPELRRSRVARAEPHRQGGRARGHPLVRGAEPDDEPGHRPAGDVRARRLADEPAVAVDGQHRDGQAGQHRARLQRIRRRTTTRRSATPAAPRATRPAR